MGFDALTEPAARLELMAKQKEQAQIDKVLAELHSLAKHLYDPEEKTPHQANPEHNNASAALPSDTLSPTDSTDVTKPISSRLESDTRFHPTIHRFILKLKEQIELPFW